MVPVGEVGLHVRLEIVGALEQFAADFALAAGCVWCCEAALRLSIWSHCSQVAAAAARQRQRFEVVRVEVVLDIFGLLSG
jgi:hypothetical protein